ncbi:MAG: hypothetical protein JHC31_00430 [Sulfurihydrogenibium sp.]|jgi:hypothetical protein|nr:hypothetical protein [Sulfurihydrogenibium sp.]
MAAGLQALKDAMGRDVLMTVKKTDNGYTIEYDMAQLEKKGKETITVGKDGSLMQASVDTGRGLVMIDHGRVKIGGQDVTSLISDYQQQFRETMAVNIGRTLAEKLHLGVSDETAKIIGNAFMKSKSWGDFKQNLKDVIDTNSKRKGDKKEHKHEEGTENKDADITQNGWTAGGGFGLGFGQGANKLGVQVGYSYSSMHQDQNAKVSSDKQSTSNTEENSNTHDEKKGESSGYKEDTMKQLQHFVQDMDKYSKTLSKSFDDTKQETYQRAYEETKSASFAQQMAQRFGVELTPEALQKLEDTAAYAEKTGDTTAFIRAMGEISRNSNYWLGMDSSELRKTKENVQNNIDGVVGDVTKMTNQVSGQTKGIEQDVPQFQLWADQAASLNPNGPQVNLKDTISEPKKPLGQRVPKKGRPESPNKVTKNKDDK